MGLSSIIKTKVEFLSHYYQLSWILVIIRIESSSICTKKAVSIFLLLTSWLVFIKKEDKLIRTLSRITFTKQGSKSFWRFKRSSSLNCGSGYGPSLCPLPLLSRSNSTGSAASQKQNSKKNHPSVAVPKIPSQYSSTWGSYQKPPLKKSYGSYGNGGGVRVNPVLNVHSGNLFGLGSIFGKEKSKRKWFNSGVTVYR